MVDLPIIDGVGLEFEVASIPENLGSGFLADIGVKGWRNTHDGSTVNPRYNVGSRFVFPSLVKGGNDRNGVFGVNCGTEFVSPPMDTTEDTWLDKVKLILDKLSDIGEWPNVKTSLHVHINSKGFPHYFLKNLLELWLRIEDAVYRISVGEMGYHRGNRRKNFLYCRPLLNPPIIASDDCFRPCFSVDGLRAARNLKEFFLAYGNHPIDAPVTKYSPPRYTDLNFYSFLSFGTVEFRTFNMTLDWRNVKTWVNLCKAIVRESLAKPQLERPILPLGIGNNSFGLDDFQAILGLEEPLMLDLERMWLNSTWVPFDNTVGVLTHLRENNRIIWNNKIEDALVPPKYDGPVISYSTDESGNYMRYQTYGEFNRGAGRGGRDINHLRDGGVPPRGGDVAAQEPPEEWADVDDADDPIEIAPQPGANVVELGMEANNNIRWQAVQGQNGILIRRR